MRTRCQRMDQALDTERVNLFNDLSTHLLNGAYERAPAVIGLVIRIRHISEVLGYPSDWHLLPWNVHPWYAMIEHFPAAGMYVKQMPDLDWSAQVSPITMCYPSDELRDLLAQKFDPEDPDGWVEYG